MSLQKSLRDFFYGVFPFLRSSREALPHQDNTDKQFWPTLTNREIEVAHLIHLGYSNEAIAQELDISVATVKTHVHNLLVKFNASSRWVLRDILSNMETGGQPGPDR